MKILSQFHLCLALCVYVIENNGQKMGRHKGEKKVVKSLEKLVATERKESEKPDYYVEKLVIR